MGLDNGILRDGDWNDEPMKVEICEFCNELLEDCYCDEPGPTLKDLSRTVDKLLAAEEKLQRMLNEEGRRL